MSLTLVCPAPGCGRTLRLSADPRGRPVRCNICGHVFRPDTTTTPTRSTVDLFRSDSLLERHGVTILPASAFTTTPRPVQAARLGFASMDQSELKKATQRLRAALDDSSLSRNGA